MISKAVLDRYSQFRLTRFYRNPKHSNFILGNSRAVNSVNEKYANEKLHVDVINLGFNGMPYSSLKPILDDVNKLNRNVTIYVEISALVNNVFDDSYAYYISNSPELKKEYKSTPFNWLQLLRLNNEIFLRNIYYLRKSDNDWINNYSISKALIEQIKNDKRAIVTFPNEEELMARIVQIQRLCEAHQNKVIFFLAPYYPDYLKQMADYKRVTDHLLSRKDIVYYDLNTLPLPPNSFADRLHTNVSGATALTDFLLKTIKE